MEKLLKNAFNAAVGVAEVAKNTVDETVQNLKTTFDDLIAKGASVETNTAKSVRETTDNIAVKLTEYQAKATEFTTSLKDQVEKGLKDLKLNGALDKAQTIFNDFKTKIEDSLGNTKESVPDSKPKTKKAAKKVA